MQGDCSGAARLPDYAVGDDYKVTLHNILFHHEHYIGGAGAAGN